VNKRKINEKKYKKLKQIIIKKRKKPESLYESSWLGSRSGGKHFVAGKFNSEV